MPLIIEGSLCVLTTPYFQKTTSKAYKP